MSLHIIHFMKEIIPDTFHTLQHCALSAVKQEASKIHIHLSSQGGNNDMGFAAYHLLRSLPVPVTIKCVGNVESMAVVLFLAADERVITPHGKIKIHPMHWAFGGGPIDHNRLSEYVDSLDFDAKRYAAIFNERTTTSTTKMNVVSHLSGKAKLLTAEEAVEAGIATKIEEVEISKEAEIWWV